MFSKPEKKPVQRKQTSKANRKGKGVVQTKIKVGAPDDKYEKEADAMADKVVSMPAPKNAGEGVQRKGALDEEAAQTKPLASLITPRVQRMSEDEELDKKPIQRMSEDEELDKKPIQRMSEDEDLDKKPIQRMNDVSSEASAKEEEDLPAGVQTKAGLDTKPIQRMNKDEELDKKPIQKKANEPGDVGSSLESKLKSTKGGGNAMDVETNEFMSSRFGTDFSGVKVHTDSNAVQMNKELNSQAFAHGNHIYFNQGKYDTTSSSGKHLLAHELTHTVQQGDRDTRSSIQEKKKSDSTESNKMTSKALFERYWKSFIELYALPIRDGILWRKKVGGLLDDTERSHEGIYEMLLGLTERVLTADDEYEGLLPTAVLIKLGYDDMSSRAFKTYPLKKVSSNFYTLFSPTSMDLKPSEDRYTLISGSNGLKVNIALKFSAINRI